MQKPLRWIVAGIVVLALLLAIVLRLPPTRDQFDQVMTAGQGSLEKGDATNAIAAYLKAVSLAPESVDAHLNLANSYLLAGENQAGIDQAQEALNLDRNNPAAFYLLGLGWLHLNQAEKAVQAFQESQKIDPAVTALNFQLALAQERLGHLEDAIHEFETILQFEPEHPSAHYQLSRLYQRLGRATEAADELKKHQELLAKSPGAASGPGVFERCKYTQARIAFRLEQPERRGVSVRFENATGMAFGEKASAYRGPIGVLDFTRDGRNRLFVMDGGGFRLLENSKGKFTALGEAHPGVPGALYRRCLVGDLNNDRIDDVLVLGEQASHVFRFGTNGEFREITVAANLKGLKARDGLLADLDFTGRLDLLTVLPEGQGILTYRNLGNAYFQQNTNSGLPGAFPGVEQVWVDDFNEEDVPGVLIARAASPPTYFAKQRAGAFVLTNSLPAWPAGGVIAAGDLNNDLRLDFVVAGQKELQVAFGGVRQPITLALQGLQVKGICLCDFDNDGWLDIVAYGTGLRVWRNRGEAGFEDVTSALGLDRVGPVDFLVAADFDGDGDTDFVTGSSAGLAFWRNDGGNVNKQLKLNLVGNRSNASGLGARVELMAGHWRAIRTLNQLPFEIGVGTHGKIDLLKTRWFDLGTTMVDLPVTSEPLSLAELVLPTGSCPYLYAWDGHQYRFVTDILGSSPLGLPVSETHFVEADPEEFLYLGHDQDFPARNGNYEVRITEELREVLYLDEAKLVVVDHPANTRIETTGKMLPGKPFPPHELWTISPVASLRKAIRSDGLDVTKALASTDNELVKPVRLREPQLRGLAEPFSITMDFGELPSDRPLVLILTGWIRFGGGMANVAASLDSTLPFPFPALEVELSDGTWKPVQTTVGVPAGKTKTILVDLEKALPVGARRVRLSMAYELYWDSAAFGERVSGGRNRTTILAAKSAELHWRGFSEFADLPSWLPLTPQYEKTRGAPPWRRTPSGWCTRYGAVGELVERQDDALVLLNGGDEVALSFEAAQLPPTTAGYVRDFFLYVVGWDKDADFHVGQGWRVDPLPFAGMEDQEYGRQARPAGLSNDWIQKYNTRWVGPLVLSRLRP